MGFPGRSVVKNPPANAGDVGSIPGLGRSPGEGNGNPVQYSCLGNPMDRGGWQATAREDCKRVRHDFIVDLKCCVSFRCTQSDTILCVCVCVCVCVYI